MLPVHLADCRRLSRRITSRAARMVLAAGLLMLASLPARAAAGDVDPTFNPGTGPTSRGSVAEVVLQPDGKVIVVGLFFGVGGAPRGGVARLNADGSLDTSFAGPGANSGVSAAALQPDGKILIGGLFTSVNGTPREKIARLNADGSLDTSFESKLRVDVLVKDIVVQPNGKLLVAGLFTTTGTTVNPGVARLNADGSVDATFSVPQLDNTVDVMALQPDGRVVIGGFFTSVNGVTRRHVARLNANGALDTSFLASGAGANEPVFALSVRPDGRVVIGGFFSSFNDTPRGRIARLHADGSLDTSFLNSGAGAESTVWALAFQTDGRVVIVGDFSSYNGTPRERIARLNADGSLDTSFLASGAGADTTVSAVAVQPDGRVLVGGFFSSIAGTARDSVARLEPSGAPDATFVPAPIVVAHAQALALQPDGKVLIGGVFTRVNGVTRLRLARLEASGALDAAFPSVGSGASNTVEAVAVQPDGKILVGGRFTNVNNSIRRRVARLNADGSVDAAFNANVQDGIV
ncbi:MAG TPA: delta-60 repeat domain-containing protein, partial [Pyrinomonadaceae bacterium]|nr:delta-60 repeat domain-containing protein [Pyrinomonadaceae bacterium]